MRIRKFVSVCLSLVLALCAVSASAEVITFAGIPWGSGAEEVCTALVENHYVTSDLTAEILLSRMARAKQYFVYTDEKFPGDDNSGYCPVSFDDDRERQFIDVNLSPRQMTDFKGSGIYMDYPVSNVDLSFARNGDDVKLYGIMARLQVDDVWAAFADLKEKLSAQYGECNTNPLKGGGMFMQDGIATWLGDDDTALVMGIITMQGNSSLLLYHVSLNCKDMLQAAVDNQ